MFTPVLKTYRPRQEATGGMGRGNFRLANHVRSSNGWGQSLCHFKGCGYEIGVSEQSHIWWNSTIFALISTETCIRTKPENCKARTDKNFSVKNNAILIQTIFAATCLRFFPSGVCNLAETYNYFFYRDIVFHAQHWISLILGCTRTKSLIWSKFDPTLIRTNRNIKTLTPFA